RRGVEYLAIVARGRVAEERAADAVDLHLARRRTARDCPPALPVQLRRGTVDVVAVRLRHLGDVAAGNLGQHHALAVATNEPRRQIQGDHTPYSVRRRRADDNVPADDDQIDAL